MGIHDEPVTLVASPSYPNSIAWSKENLVAIASGHLITILNPASPVRPRGLITLPPCKPFPIGVIQKDELLAPCVAPLSLQRDAFNSSRDSRRCARSISWSPLGFSPNAGCLLAVCTTEGHVKIYRSPFCEYRPEWVEVADVSNILYHYLKRINFQERKDPSAMFCPGQADVGCNGSINIMEGSSTILPEHGKRRASSRRTQENKYVKFLVEQLSDSEDVNHRHKISDDEYDDPAARKKSKITTTSTANPCPSFDQGSSAEKFARGELGRTTSAAPELITARQYASRSALLSSLIVAWSPTIRPSEGDHLDVKNNWSVLAVGGKSGNISFWRIHEPQCYTIEHGGVPVDPVLIGLRQCHSSWITAITWGIHASNSSDWQLVLATGSCDGSVKIWLADVQELFKSSEADTAPLTLLREVTSVSYVPVSTISLVVPLPSPDKIVLAIGRGSGSFEVCIFHMSSKELQNMGVYNAHNQVVTGLAWAFDGRCLYSCSQDNSVRSWVLHGSSLCETAFPSKFPGPETSINSSQVSDLCFGLALSPGELVVAVVRSLDSGLLNPMYQARIQKAAVEFYWGCEQSLADPSDKRLDGGNGTSSDFSETWLEFWESTILWSLKHCEYVDKTLVIWDIFMALLTFQKTEPSFVERIIVKWMSSWFLDYESSLSDAAILFHMQSMLRKMSTRRLQLLNIICRKLILCENNLGINHDKVDRLEGEERMLDSWNKILVDSERELQERLVSYTFINVLRRASCSRVAPSVDGNWTPVGVAQMRRWVDIIPALVHDQLGHLGSKIGELGSRIRMVCEYEEEESCSYCSASVPFESAGVARCKGVQHPNGSVENHELKRCAVSMRLGPVASPMWFCMCCERQVVDLPPLSFFKMSEFPSDVNYENESSVLQETTKPLCPFCGILLQRLLPDFLLSASPV